MSLMMKSSSSMQKPLNLSSNENRGEPLSPKYFTIQATKRLIEDEQNKCRKTLENLSKKLEEERWVLTDEIDLKVAQEKLLLLSQFKDCLYRLGFYDKTLI